MVTDYKRDLMAAADGCNPSDNIIIRDGCLMLSQPQSSGAVSMPQTPGGLSLYCNITHPKTEQELRELTTRLETKLITFLLYHATSAIGQEIALERVLIDFLAKSALLNNVNREKEKQIIRNWKEIFTGIEYIILKRIDNDSDSKKATFNSAFKTSVAIVDRSTKSQMNSLSSSRDTMSAQEFQAASDTIRAAYDTSVKEYKGVIAQMGLLIDRGNASVKAKVVRTMHNISRKVCFLWARYNDCLDVLTPQQLEQYVKFYGERNCLMECLEHAERTNTLLIQCDSPLPPAMRSLSSSVVLAPSDVSMLTDASGFQSPNPVESPGAAVISSPSKQQEAAQQESLVLTSSSNIVDSDVASPAAAQEMILTTPVNVSGPVETSSLLPLATPSALHEDSAGRTSDPPKDTSSTSLSSPSSLMGERPMSLNQEQTEIVAILGNNHVRELEAVLNKFTVSREDVGNFAKFLWEKSPRERFDAPPKPANKKKDLKNSKLPTEGGDKEHPPLSPGDVQRSAAVLQNYLLHTSPLSPATSVTISDASTSTSATSIVFETSPSFPVFDSFDKVVRILMFNLWTVDEEYIMHLHYKFKSGKKHMLSRLKFLHFLMVNKDKAAAEVTASSKDANNGVPLVRGTPACSAISREACFKPN